jgi:hypothetical protein
MNLGSPAPTIFSPEVVDHFHVGMMEEGNDGIRHDIRAKRNVVSSSRQNRDSLQTDGNGHSAPEAGGWLVTQNQ